MQSLETKRLILRSFQKKDIAAIYAILSDEEVNTFLPMFPLQNIEEASDYYDQHYLNQQDGYTYAICLKKDNIPIGYVHVSNHESHDFGYALKKTFWHQGIVSEACNAVIEQLKKEHYDYITATHDIRNPRSGSVMKRLGMTYQYTYQEQWQPKNILVTFRMYQLNLNGEHPVYRGYWNQYPIHYIEMGI